MSNLKTSYQYKQEKIAKLEMDLKVLSVQYEKEFLKRKELEKQLKELELKYVSLDGENNRLYQHDCQLVNELKEAYKTIDKLEGNHNVKDCETCKNKNTYREDEPCRHCVNYHKWQPKEDLKPEPVYIPFTFADAELLIGKAVRYKNKSMYCFITSITDTWVHTGANYKFTFTEMFKGFEFIDGLPCGKLAE